MPSKVGTTISAEVVLPAKPFLLMSSETADPSEPIQKINAVVTDTRAVLHQGRGACRLAQAFFDIEQTVRTKLLRSWCELTFAFSGRLNVRPLSALAIWASATNVDSWRSKCRSIAASEGGFLDPAAKTKYQQPTRSDLPDQLSRKSPPARRRRRASIKGVIRTRVGMSSVAASAAFIPTTMSLTAAASPRRKPAASRLPPTSRPGLDIAAGGPKAS